MLSHESDDVVWWWLLLFRVAICFSLRVVRFSFHFDTLCPEFVSRCACCVSRFAFCVLRFSFHFGICCNLFLVARISQLNCYAFLVSLWHLLCSVSRFSFRVSRSCFAFRVSRFTLTFAATFFSLRVFQNLISQLSGWEAIELLLRFSSHFGLLH